MEFQPIFTFTTPEGSRASITMAPLGFTTILDPLNNLPTRYDAEIMFHCPMQLSYDLATPPTFTISPTPFSVMIDPTPLNMLDPLVLANQQGLPILHLIPYCVVRANKPDLPLFIREPLLIVRHAPDMTVDFELLLHHEVTVLVPDQFSFLSLDCAPRLFGSGLFDPNALIDEGEIEDFLLNASFASLDSGYLSN
jgi:hypothetical protein